MARPVGTRWIYCRVGCDERPRALLRYGAIGEGNAECERRWDVFLDEQGPLLIISSWQAPTWILSQRGDMWVGRWHHERMPVEFLPLHS
ncbi:MAG: hypothetical protein NZ700_09645 [Gemmataceae bacterium]|nr:hypothetical protein [Gemmataceae bacterium]MDW8264168.1 hypothetical protein [Gemmataceae bacterium]